MVKAGQHQSTNLSWVQILAWVNFGCSGFRLVHFWVQVSVSGHGQSQQSTAGQQ
ncbi:hypothetical protein HanXRQr2_Chr05g0222721 [Helianthus annuus]|uniref:Uncharacterized protein n=1 Tax=Helianthus annuus TaxID=4232 RepID=A0A9K3J0G4_HELAN|nr:hypothetical protein HanXRQr2_Chr05g0222721 [Helianthus annuus]KAJ0923365.1 hypothetical protein HanPSC8_Chr05g0215061 [Helianthus annuus]